MKKEADAKRFKNELKKALNKARMGLKKIGKDTAIAAKRGKEELSKIVKAGKVEVDILGLDVRKNQIYYELGKEVHQLHARGRLTAKNIKALCLKIDWVENEIRAKKSAVTNIFKEK